MFIIEAKNVNKLKWYILIKYAVSIFKNFLIEVINKYSLMFSSSNYNTFFIFK